MCDKVHETCILFKYECHFFLGAELTMRTYSSISLVFFSNLTYIHVSTLLCQRLNVAEQYRAHQFHNKTEDLNCDAVDLRRSEFCLPFDHNVRWQTNDDVDDHKYYQDDVDCLTSWRQAHYLRFESYILQHNAVNGS